MAASNLNLGKASGGVLNVQPADGTTTTSLVLPAINGTVVAADSNGNVGIGVSSPAGNLDVFKTSSAVTYVRTANQTLKLSADDSAGKVDVANAAGTPMSFTIGTTERMRIDSSGNLGIGVTPSAWSTTVSSKAIQLGYSTSIASLYAGTFYNNAFLGLTANSYVDASAVPRYIANSYATQYTQSSGSHYWQTAPSGTVGNVVAWTTAMALDANANLNVRSALNIGYDGSSYSGGLGGLQCFYGSNTNLVALYPRNTSDTSTVFQSNVAGAYKAGILANGSFQSATNSYGSTSDAKLKENVQDASPKLDKLMQVQVRTFNYIGQEDKQIGVVAQEIEKIFPSIVYETKDTKQVEVEKEREKTLEDGTVEIEKYTEMETVETGEITKNVKYSVIYMMMLKAMQEQNEIIKDLKSRIEILEAK